MAFVHGKGTAVSIDGGDLSAYSNSVAFNRSADTHETTTFGKNSKTYKSGLKDGTATIEGLYDSTATTGPGATFRPLLGGDEVPFEYMPEGATVGKPVATVAVLVSAYEETAPVADMITFSATLQFTGDIADSTTTAP